MKKGIIFITIGILALACQTGKIKTDYNSVLWYSEPAQFWNSQGLHLGNGFFGATFFGGTEREVFALSEKSMWTGGPAKGDWERAGVNAEARAVLPKIRKAIVDGKTRLADSLVINDFFGKSDLYGHFTSIGDMVIDFTDHERVITDYKRALDLSNSLGMVQYRVNDVQYSREYFCSYPDRILALSFRCSKPAQINFSISFDLLQDSTFVKVHGNTINAIGFINDNHRPFQVTAVIKNEGGIIIESDSAISVEDANRVDIFLTIATDYQMKYPDYKGEAPDKRITAVLQTIESLSYDQLKQNHISDYRSLYDRVKLEIAGDPALEQLSTDQRYQNLKSGGIDPGYKNLAFNLGRYLIISSSRPGTLPANLQGVWNTFNVAPWAGNYQSNINLQEIYWSCGPVDLPECQQAYIDWIENLSISGREIAKRVYGTEGWVSHTIGNIWGHCAPMGGIQWGLYPVGAAWHCQHVWDQFAFTQDMEYLKGQAYPILKDASIFWLKNLVPFEGYLISAPTVSAEHGALRTSEGLNPAFHDFRSRDYEYNIPGVYQDVEMIYDLFTNTSQAARLIGEAEFADSLLGFRGRLLPLKIGKHGQLQEWYEDIDNPECHHRHIAHLYAVCPGSQISPVTTPELSTAAKIALDMRGDGRFPEQELASGGNWARADRMWCWTRLHEGNRANKILTELLTEEGFENVTTYQHASYDWERDDLFKENDSMFCHFQLDATASVPGCIAEMLLQSHMDEIHLLPALPDEFHSGKVSGLKARGGYIVDMAWKNKELVNASIHCYKDKPHPPVRIRETLIGPKDIKKINFIYDLKI